MLHLALAHFSFQCVEEDGILKPFTRDTFSSCIKATYCEIDHKPYPIFKNPKEGGFKKSQKGCCLVYKNDNGELCYKDEYTWKEVSCNSKQELKAIFRNSELLIDDSLANIRNRLHNNNF